MEPSNLLDALLNSRIDVGISRTPVNTTEVTSTKLWADNVVVALPRRHALSKKERLRLSDLRSEPFIMLKLEASTYAEHIRDCCIQTGFTPKAVHWVAQVPAAVSLVAAGMGVALIPESVSKLYPDLIHMIPLESELIRSDVYVIRHNKNTQKTTHKFVRYLIMKSTK